MHVYIHTYTPRTYLLTCIHKYVHACLQAPVCAPFRPKSPHTKGRRANHEPQPQLLQRRCQLCPASVVPVLPSVFVLRADVRRKRMCVYTYAYVLYSILYMCACVCTRTRLCAHAHTETRTYLIAHNETHTHTLHHRPHRPHRDTDRSRTRPTHAPSSRRLTLVRPCVCPCSAEAALAATTALVVACLLRFRLRPLVKQR